MSEVTSFKQRGATYTEERKLRKSQEPQKKAEIPPNIDPEKNLRPNINLVMYDKSSRHGDESVIGLISGWNDKNGNIKCSWSVEKPNGKATKHPKLTRDRLKTWLRLAEKNENIVTTINLRFVYEDDLIESGVVRITAVKRNTEGKDKFVTLWVGMLDAETQIITGSFKPDINDILNIFDRCTSTEDGERDMYLRIFRGKDSANKQLITSDLSRYVFLKDFDNSSTTEAGE